MYQCGLLHSVYNKNSYDFGCDDVADFAEDSTQMTDYYGDFLSEETHM